ncbi:MAG: relaxase domain-containing protein, partial [Proteobacteria bacterium]|nr:relaxase domain-containing protein [Pseudomonadota bacterium]
PGRCRASCASAASAWRRPGRAWRRPSARWSPWAMGWPAPGGACPGRSEGWRCCSASCRWWPGGSISLPTATGSLMPGSACILKPACVSRPPTRNSPRQSATRCARPGPRQEDGVREIVATGNLVVATFDHATSRELDPQLHTHAVVANLTRRNDGSWGALHNPSLFPDKMHLGRVYRSELARGPKALGYAPEITAAEKGLFEVKGVPHDLLVQEPGGHGGPDHLARRRPGGAAHP